MFRFCFITAFFLTIPLFISSKITKTEKTKHKNEIKVNSNKPLKAFSPIKEKVLPLQRYFLYKY